MGALPWIKVATALPRDEKTIHFRVELQTEWAWAHIVLLWMECAKSRPHGEFTGRGCEDIIEEWAQWKGKRGAFVAAATRAGFLDELSNGYRIHAWEKWAGAHIEQRRKDRVRKERERHADGPVDSPPEVTRKSRGQSKGKDADKGPEKPACHADGHAEPRLKTQETLRSKSDLSGSDHDRPSSSPSVPSLNDDPPPPLDLVRRENADGSIDFIPRRYVDA